MRLGLGIFRTFSSGGLKYSRAGVAALTHSKHHEIVVGVVAAQLVPGKVRRENSTRREDDVGGPNCSESVRLVYGSPVKCKARRHSVKKE